MRPPRILRAWAALGASYVTAGVSHVMLWRAKAASRRAADRLDLALGIRAIARDLGVSRRQAWALIRSGEVDTFTLAGGPCAHRTTLRAWSKARSTGV